MRKMVLLLGMSALLAGCDLMGGTTEESQESQVSESTESSVESSEESSASSESSSESSAQESSASSSESSASESTNGEAVTSEFPLVPQKSEIDAGYTLENDTLLQEIQTRMNQTEVLGIEDDVAIHFTGLFLGEQGQDNVQAVFIIVNRTNMALTNIELTVSMSTTDEEVILNKAPFSLSEDDFGIIEPDTVMPAYFKIPMASQETFFSVTNLDNVTYSIDSFTYEER